MMLTEAEAATKRCPMSFGPMPAATVMVSQPINQFGHSWSSGGITSCSPVNCIGSGCMAWRVGVAAVPAHPGNVLRTAGDGKDYYQKGTERPAIPAKGYCGLAR